MNKIFGTTTSYRTTTTTSGLSFVIQYYTQKKTNILSRRAVEMAQGVLLLLACSEMWLSDCSRVDTAASGEISFRFLACQPTHSNSCLGKTLTHVVASSRHIGRSSRVWCEKKYIFPSLGRPMTLILCLSHGCYMYIGFFHVIPSYTSEFTK